ncbi:MAG: VRR-NUC domain-containing protein [Dehalococcoidia bacterium]
MNEAELTTLVIDMAKTFGWLVHHQRPGRMADGRWRSSIQGHKGFPDLVLVHPETGVLIFAELKSEKGRLRPEQKLWMHSLAYGYSYYIWRPSDWDEIEEVLGA